MRRHSGCRYAHMRRGQAPDVEPAVVSVASREKIDVKNALRSARRIERDEELAHELVRIAVDADEATISSLVRTMGRIQDEMWRARTLFSVLEQTRTTLRRTLPNAAQNAVVTLVKRISDEAARTVALRKLTADLPPALRKRLAALGEAIADPLRRLQVAVAYETEPTEERARSLLQVAAEIPDEEKRGEALATVAPRLGQPRLEDAFAAAMAINSPDVRGLAAVRVAARFSDEQRRSRAQTEILRMTSSIAEPLRRFDVTAALHDLSAPEHRRAQSLLLDIATAIDDPELRCRGMLVTAGFARNERVQKRALLAAIAAAESVWDEERRAELFLLLRPEAPRLPATVRRELTRAVERLESPEIRKDLYTTLGRFFSYERQPQDTAPVAPAKKDMWDVFISYPTADLAEARLLASELRSRGLRVFLSADVLDAQVGSASWLEAIDEALEGSRALVVLLTSETPASKWVADEWRKYHRLIIETGSGRLLCLRLRGPKIAELPLTLRMYQCLESSSGQIEQIHLTRIIDVVQGR